MGGFSASAPMCLTGLVLSVRPCHDFGDLQARGKARRARRGSIIKSISFVLFDERQHRIRPPRAQHDGRSAQVHQRSGPDEVEVLQDDACDGVWYFRFVQVVR